MSDALLEIKDLNIVYQTDEETVHAVSRISLAVHTKETLGLIGETGTGKTTTALAIVRLLPKRIRKVEQEQILFNGENLLDLKEGEMLSVRGQKIAMIFQDPMINLSPVFAVENQILEAPQFHNHNSLSRAQVGKKVEEMLKLMGISATRKNCYPHGFSGGMKQRVVVAVALACNPRLLIAGKPTTALDVTIQAQVLGMMEELEERFGTPILLITRDLDVVAQTYDRVAIMYAGGIVEYEAIGDIFMRKRHRPYTRDLFGSIPSMTGDAKRLNPVAGLMPGPTNLLQGCKFHIRCPHYMKVCRHSLSPICKEGTHETAYHLFVDKENVTSDGEEVMRI